MVIAGRVACGTAGWQRGEETAQGKDKLPRVTAQVDDRVCRERGDNWGIVQSPKRF